MGNVPTGVFCESSTNDTTYLTSVGSVVVLRVDRADKTYRGEDPSFPLTPVSTCYDPSGTTHRTSPTGPETRV